MNTWKLTEKGANKLSKHRSRIGWHRTARTHRPAKIPKHLGDMQWFWHFVHLHWPATSYSKNWDQFSKIGKTWSRQDRTIRLDHFALDHLSWIFSISKGWTSFNFSLFIYIQHASKFETSRLLLQNSACHIPRLHFRSGSFDSDFEHRVQVTIWTSFMRSLLIIWACFHKWTPGQGL